MTNAKIVKVTRYASLLGGGVFAGVTLTVLVLELALRRLDGPEYVRVRQAEFDFFTWFIGATFVPTLVAVTMLVILARRARPRVPAGGGCARSSAADRRDHARGQRADQF